MNSSNRSFVVPNHIVSSQHHPRSVRTNDEISTSSVRTMATTALTTTPKLRSCSTITITITTARTRSFANKPMYQEKNQYRIETQTTTFVRTITSLVDNNRLFAGTLSRSIIEEDPPSILIPTNTYSTIQG